MVHIRFAHPRWQAPRRLGLPGRLLVGALALGIGLAVAMLALLSGIVFLAVTLVMRGWRAVVGPRRRGSALQGDAVVRPPGASQRHADVSDVQYRELP